MGKMNIHNPMIQQIIGILAIVIAITMMSTVLDEFDAIQAVVGFSALPILPTIIKLFPALIYLVLIALGAILDVKGGLALSKENPILGIVTAIIGLIVFLAMFVSIITASVSLAGRNNIAGYTLMPTLVGLVPTVLFILGIFGSGWLAYQNAKAEFGGKGKSKAAAA